MRDAIMRFVGLVAVLMLPLSGGANDLTDHMHDATVRVLCVDTNGQTGTGSGFVVGGGRYVVSNWHVAKCTASGGRAQVLLHAARGDKANAEVLAYHAGKDLAVLRLDRSSGRETVRFASVATLESRDSLTAVGFPGAADQVGGMAARSEPTMTTGVISRILSLPENGSAAAQLAQVSAQINPGNSGGPLFDAYGRVVGVNTMKALTQVATITGEGMTMQRVPVGEGIGWAVITDELLPMLDRLQVSYDVSRSRPNILQEPWFEQPLVATLLVVLIVMTVVALSLASTRRGRAAVYEGMSRMFIPERNPLPSGPVPAPPKPDHPVLRGLSGLYAGASIPLSDGTPVAIGRDPTMVQLVMPKNQPKVGKRHASICYNAARGYFELEDCWSSCGTFVDPGQQALGSGRTRVLSGGDRFYLGSPEVGFEVGFDAS